MKEQTAYKKKKIWKERILATCFLLPTLAVFSVFMFWPIIRTIELSFYKWNMVSPHKKFVGLSNYEKILTDPTFHKVICNTIWYILLFIVIDFVIPYVISYLLSFVIKKGKQIYRTAFFIPSLTTDLKSRT